MGPTVTHTNHCHHQALPTQWGWIRLDEHTALERFRKLTELEATAYEHPSDHFEPQDYLDYIRSANAQTWVLVDANDSDAWYGSVVWADDVPWPHKDKEVTTRLLQSNTVYLAGVAIFPAFQGYGLSRHLFGKLIEENPGKRFVTKTRESKRHVQKLLELAGFSFEQQHERPDGTWLWYTRPAHADENSHRANHSKNNQRHAG